LSLINFSSVRVELANGAAQPDPGTVRQPVVQDVKVEVPTPSQAQPIVEGAGEGELTFCEYDLHNLPSVFVVFDEKDSFFLSDRVPQTFRRSIFFLFFEDTPLYDKVKISARKVGEDEDGAVLYRQCRIAYHFHIA
jgi:hypothetical protein